MGPVKGRTDDMLIVRGVNLYPAQIESALQGLDELSPHYQLVLTRQKTLDNLELRIEVSQAAILASGQRTFDAEALEPLQRRVRRRIKESVGLSVQVTLLAPGQAPRSQGGKLSRVEDRRGE
jgi:phenylacetate-CoA ligase